MHVRAGARALLTLNRAVSLDAAHSWRYLQTWGGVAVTQRDYKSTSHEGLGQLVEPRISNGTHAPGYGACGSSSKGGYSSVSSK